MKRLAFQSGAILCFAFLSSMPAPATPYFARAYGMSCQGCHNGFPRLNRFGLAFRANNYRIPGAEEQPTLIRQKTFPLSFKILPAIRYAHPDGGKTQVTRTQLISGGLLTPTTAFKMRHDLWVDADPRPFPSEEFWIQQVVDNRRLLLLKAGQFDLPIPYQPATSTSVVFNPLLLDAGSADNAVRLGAPMSGLQLSGLVPNRLRWYVAYGAPGSAAPGNLVGERQFYGRFRDLFVRIAMPDPDRQAGLFAYFTHPRHQAAPASDRSYRIGLDGTLFWDDYQLYGILLYGEDRDPGGLGQKGVLRAGFLELDRQFHQRFGVTVRWEFQDASVGSANRYADAKTLSLRFYPTEKLRLIAEFQLRDHGTSASAFLARISF